MPNPLDDVVQPHITIIEHEGKRLNVTVRIIYDGIEYVGRLWFSEEGWDDDGLTDRGALPGRTKDDVIALARGLSVGELKQRYRRALAEKRRFHKLRQSTDEILSKIRYLNQVAISMRAGLLDVEGAASEIAVIERQLHDMVDGLRKSAGVET